MNPALASHLEALGLERAAFPPTPDAQAWFRTPALDAALVEAAHCLRTRAGFVLLTGEVGTGKSTFLRRLLDELDDDGVTTSLVFNTFLQGPDLLVAVLRDFGLAATGTPASDLETLNRFLVERWRAQATCVLVIDDAQNLDTDSLELLRLLTNLETGQEKLLQIVLAGQPELHAHLAQPRIRQLTSRICTHVQLDTMTVPELDRYVTFRLGAAGSTDIALDPAAVAALHRASGGNPRRAHLIMDRCLYGLYGHGEGRRRIDAQLVRKAAAQAGVRSVHRRPKLPLALAASVAGVLAIGALALLPQDADSHDAARGPVATPPAVVDADSAPATDARWQTCLQSFAGQAFHVQPVDAAFAARLSSLDGSCLRHDAGHWRAAWRIGLRPNDFLHGSDDAPLRRVQALLHAQGLYDGTVDGRFGPRMRAALHLFQAHHGLPADGAPDPATLLLIDALLADAGQASPSTSPESVVHGHG